MASSDMLEFQIRLKVLPGTRDGNQESLEETAHDLIPYMRRQGYDIQAVYKGEMGPGVIGELIIKGVEILGDAVIAAMIKEAAEKAVREVYQHIVAFFEAKRSKQRQPAPIEAEVLSIGNGPTQQVLSVQELQQLANDVCKQVAQHHGPIAAEVSRKTTTETTIKIFIP